MDIQEILDRLEELEQDNKSKFNGGMARIILYSDCSGYIEMTYSHGDDRQILDFDNIKDLRNRLGLSKERN